MTDLSQTLDRMLLKLGRRAVLCEADRAALLELPFRIHTIEPHHYIAREGERTKECCLMLEGVAYRQKATLEGARQILSLHLQGDFVDLEASMLRRADHSIQALTRCRVGSVPVTAIRELQCTFPSVARAMWVDTLIDAAIFREWMLNIGQRDAKARIAHLLCEFATRMELVGLSGRNGCEFPMTQEQLGDATGLTPVHVNRTLKLLQGEGLIWRKRRLIHIADWDGLRAIAGFSEAYLHLDQLEAS